MSSKLFLMPMSSSPEAEINDEGVARHPIGIVARRTALKPDLIRAWERRYQAVRPQRTAGRHRFYSDLDIERLTLLRKATEHGRSIGQIAALSREELLLLVREDQQAAGGEPVRVRSAAGGIRRDAGQYRHDCMAAVEELEARELELLLEQAAVDLSRPVLIEEMLVPLLQQIGDRWREGSLRPMHEHLSTAVVRSFIGTIHANSLVDTRAPQLVATTPSGQRHELGALMVAGIAASEGWRTTYLGPDLPASEIVAACRQKEARALALSLIYPADDPLLGDNLLLIRRHLPETCSILVGGAAAAGYRDYLDAIEAVVLEDLKLFRVELGRLRLHSKV